MNHSTSAPAAPGAFLTEAEFSARYRVPQRTVQRWRVTGHGPAFVRCGPRRVLYRLTDCEAWAASRTFAHRAAEAAAKGAGLWAASPPWSGCSRCSVWLSPFASQLPDRNRRASGTGRPCQGSEGYSAN